MRYSSQILIKLEISQQVLEKYKKRNIMKSRPVGAKLFHVDGQTDTKTDGRIDRQTRRSQQSFPQFFERT